MHEQPINHDVSEALPEIKLPRVVWNQFTEEALRDLIDVYGVNGILNTLGSMLTDNAGNATSEEEEKRLNRIVSVLETARRVVESI